MYHVRVEAEFAAAHFLSHYQGKCEQLHGHNYRVRLWAKGNELNSILDNNPKEGAMLVDFALLKDALRQVCKTLDHCNLNDNPAFTGDPSAERIARYIFEEILRILPPADAKLIYAVDVYETAANMARYERD
ncbi:MAG: 6-carboxytetrahydropterin synthase [Treponema sp.]|jgi:6-pyruvoyltetrahydropterin/6-carboxytetrahydropterin synthase|nr:6-carboxytetrahydropterin synthase [Treponema sp.]